MRYTRTKFICFMLTIALCLTSVIFVKADENTSEVKSAIGIKVDYHTQEEIKNFYKESNVATDDKLTFAQKPVIKGNYSAGKLSDETLNSAIKMLNCVRYIAGISYDVQLNDEYNNLTQAAALVNYVNGELSHFPDKPKDMDDTLYELGADGAGSSNIAWASWKNRSINETIIDGWMEDGDSSNISRVGHRRWILNPFMKYTGFGAVSGDKGTYSAMYSFDRQNTDADKYGVAWPAQNMPVEFFGSEYPWSVSMGEELNADEVKVKLVRKNDGKIWEFSKESSDGYFNVENSWYGQRGCIIFRPEFDDKTKFEAGEVYEVNISGLGEGKDVSYCVNFFNLEEKPTEKTKKPEKVKIKKYTVKNRKMTIYFKSVKDISGYQVIYASDKKYKKNLKSSNLSNKSTKVTITLKKSEKIHYVKIRAYIKKGNKKIYGTWSDNVIRRLL